MAKSKKVNKSELIRKLHDEGKSIEEIKAQTKYSDGLVRLVIRNYKKKSKKKAQFKSPRSRLVKELFQMKKALDWWRRNPAAKKLLKRRLPRLARLIG
jgi:transposase